MTETPLESPQTEFNPWESTSTGESYVDTLPNPLMPSARLLWMSIISAVVVKGLIILKTVPSHQFFTPRLLSYGIPELAMGGLMGLGIALFLHAIARKRFGQLMPGHWRLIVFALTLLIEIGGAVFSSAMLSEAGPAQPSAVAKLIQGTLTIVFYAMVLWTTQETPTWRTYAVLSVLNSFFMLSRVGTRLASTLSGQTETSDTMAGMLILSLLLQLAILVVLVVAAILDWRRKIPRDMNHHLGVYLVIFVPFMAGFIDAIVVRLLF